MDEKPKQPDGWSEAFERDEDEKRGPEKPLHVLNARQLEYIAHMKRMKREQEHVLG